MSGRGAFRGRLGTPHFAVAGKTDFWVALDLVARVMSQKGLLKVLDRLSRELTSASAGAADGACAKL